MPLAKITTSVECDDEKKQALCACLSGVCAQGIGKPESYMAVMIEDGAVASFGGKTGPFAFVELRSIGGLGREVNSKLSETICSCLEQQLDIDAERIYLNFIDVAAENWGWNSSTFA